jgi:transposase InsO family protein
VRKIHAALNREGVEVARCTIERLMRAEGLQGVRRDKSRKTTFGDGAETERPEDLVERRFTPSAPNQLWVADFTYIRTHAGWVYAAFVLDVFSRRVVGWQTSTSMRTDLALDALDMGLWERESDQPRRTSTTERCDLPDRDRQDEIPRAHDRLRHTPHRRGQEQTRHHPLPETLRDPRGLPPRQYRPANRRSHELTTIGAST